MKRDCYTGAIRRLVQRLDGFVSADAEYSGGEIVTPLVRFEGTRLQLKVDCSALGEVWVELLDERNLPIEGFTMDEAVSVDRNGVAQEVWWKQGPGDRCVCEYGCERPSCMRFSLLVLKNPDIQDDGYLPMWIKKFK